MTTQFFVRPGESDRISAEIRLEPDSRSTLHGTVKNKAGQPLSDALVMLMEAARPDAGPALSAAVFTDDDGQYYFGPLKPGTLYVVKVFYNNLKIRELEISTENS